VSDVVHARAEDERDRDGTRGQQPEEVLGGQVRGKRPAVRRAVGALAGQARTAVPVATNSRQLWPQAYICIRRFTPTMPSAARWSASARIRAIASSLALYMAWVRTCSSWFWFQRPACMPTW
jgi:hypothetical protein